MLILVAVSCGRGGGDECGDVPTSSSVAARPSIVAPTMLSSIAWRPSKSSGDHLGDAAGLQRDDPDTARPSSAARFRRSASIAVNPTWRPPRLQSRSGSPSPPNIRITPDPCLIMWRAAAVEVRKFVRTPFRTGCSKSASDISTNGVPWTSSWLITFKQMSTLPALAATAS